MVRSSARRCSSVRRTSGQPGRRATWPGWPQPAIGSLPKAPKPSREKAERILIDAVLPDLEVKVRAGGEAGRALRPYLLASLDGLVRRYVDRREVRVQRHVPVAVRDHHVVAVAATPAQVHEGHY